MKQYLKFIKEWLPRPGYIALGILDTILVLGVLMLFALIIQNITLYNFLMTTIGFTGVLVIGLFVGKYFQNKEKDNDRFTLK